MATLEGLVLDGLALNDDVTYRLIDSLGILPPSKRYEWATGGDSDGAALVRDPLSDNREVTLRVRIVKQTTMDLALAAIGAIVAKLEEAEKHPEGLDLTWTPAGSTKTFTLKVLSGEVTELPITPRGSDAGWFRRNAIVSVKLICKPFMYGTEVTGTPVTAATPVVTLTVANVAGDVPAEGRLIVTDNASQARRYMEWGLENRYYDAGQSLLLDSDSMTTTGTGGSQTTRTGAYDPGASGNNVIRATLWRSFVAVAATGNLGHVGTYRVKARVYGSGTGAIQARLSWQEGDGPYRQNPPVVLPALGVFTEVDLGIVSIPAKDLGTQRWQARVEGYTDTAGDTLDVDYLVFVPAAEGYGKARGVGLLGTEATNGYDDFETLAGAGALNARVAPAGGTWATSGVATDFTGSITGGDHQAARGTNSEATPRFAILGSTNYTNTQVEVWAQALTTQYLVGVQSSVIARWVDSSNYLTATLFATSAPYTTAAFYINQVVAGVTTTLVYVPTYYTPNFWWGIRLTAYTTGTVIAELRPGTATNAPLYVLRASSSAVATGGALATGKPGFSDLNSNSIALTRFYNWFAVGTPTAEPIVINSGRILEVRSDATLRADSAGTYYGPVPAYRGSRFLVPQAGDENRTSRVLVKAHRQDIETMDAANVTDSLTAQVNYTPRYLVVPR